MNWLILLLLVGVVLFFVLRSARRIQRRDAQTGQAPAPLPPPSPPGESSASALQELAGALQPYYEATAHPQDLLEAEAFQAGVAALSDPRIAVDQLIDYTLGANNGLAAMAAEALARRDDGTEAIDALLPYLSQANVWTAFFILRIVERHAQAPVIARVLINGADWWPRNPIMPRIVGQFVEARLQRGEAPALEAELDASGGLDLEELDARIACLPIALAPALRERLHAWQHGRIDTGYLDSVGRVWRGDPDDSPVVEHARLSAALDAALQAIDHQPPLSLLVVGESGVGKTALIRALAARLQEQGWTLFEASATDVLAGQTYIGELEKRIRELLAHLHASKRILWYVPNFHELHYAGRHRYSPVSVLDMVLPALEAGRICLIGEAQPQALEKVLQQRPRLRVAFRVLSVEPLPADTAIQLAAAVVAQDFEPHGIQVDAEALREAADLARHYLSNRAQPGNLLDLLRETRVRLLQRDAGARRLTRAELLATLSRLTGLPSSVLDDREALDPVGLRAFFQQRVMGQPEAIDCLVDRVAMLKAGLTDPARPVGVFFFAGPTGTGKTEVAKSLAEFLFGSPDRMIRLDMSEFQEPPSLARIIGDSGEASEVSALTNRIRRQPFSVVLLDEFEKAHPRVWDLFLQVFDDGRLTDALGNVADFRHSIIILTSNVGATQHQGSSLGFTDAGGAFTQSQVTRAVGQTFRPELVNRLDRVVVFRPLTKSVMREILKKELRAILGRRGFRNREWAVEWEDSAIEFLLERGFTNDMGARPLRRAIDQYVLAPIAMTIVEHRFPQGDQFLFVRGAGNAIEVAFVDPDAPAEAASAPRIATAKGAPNLADIILSPRGSEPERSLLDDGVASLVQQLDSAAWIETKEALLGQMRRSGFWDDPQRYGVLQRIEAMDAIEAGADTAQSLLRRVHARSGQGAVAPVILSNLAQQLYLMQAALRDLDDGESSDVFIGVEPSTTDVKLASGDGGWPRQLTEMYLAWGRKRRLRLQPLATGAGTWVAAVSGPGARHILSREAGLHVLEVPDASGGFDRVAARVRVAPQPAAPQTRGQPLAAHAAHCLAATPADATIVRRYRAQPSPLVRDAQDGWRTGRLDLVLGGDFDLMLERREEKA